MPTPRSCDNETVVLQQQINLSQHRSCAKQKKFSDAQFARLSQLVNALEQQHEAVETIIGDYAAEHPTEAVIIQSKLNECNASLKRVIRVRNLLDLGSRPPSRLANFFPEDEAPGHLFGDKGSDSERAEEQEEQNIPGLDPDQESSDNSGSTTDTEEEKAYIETGKGFFKRCHSAPDGLNKRMKI